MVFDLQIRGQPPAGAPATTYGESTTELATPTYLRPTPERSDTSACQAAAAIESYQAPDGYHA